MRFDVMCQKKYRMCRQAHTSSEGCARRCNKLQVLAFWHFGILAFWEIQTKFSISKRKC